mgnify:CR=1 FL=1
MPQIKKEFILDVTPERFLNACTPQELIEVDILITSPRFVSKMSSDNQGIRAENKDKKEITKL